MNQYLPLLGLALFVGVVGGLGLFATYVERLKQEDAARRRAESPEE